MPLSCDWEWNTPKHSKHKSFGVYRHSLEPERSATRPQSCTLALRGERREKRGGSSEEMFDMMLDMMLYMLEL